jgi:pyruvate,water dikinase
METCMRLKELHTEHVSRMGAKAVKLGELSRLRLAVPAGFCIPADAYSQHLADHGIDTELNSQVLTDPDRLREQLLSLRAAICAAPLSPFLLQTLRAHHPGGTVAVRSSATAEDLPEASFAGQYDTVLNVTSPEACSEAVKRCWASLWTERACHYREQNGIAHRQGRMAVIVQQQVDADMAGGAFSMDPVTGSRLRIVIEACRGLGEDLVSGRVTPERWIWRKQNLVVIGKEPRAGTELDFHVAKRLARQVRRLERHFGCPQDVEWAVKDRKLFFLQTRPITTLPAPKTWEEKQVWTNFNLGEVVPDVTTPLTTSVLESMFLPLFQPVAALVGADLSRAPLVGRVAGRFYFNLTVCFAAGHPFWLLLGRNPDTEDHLVEAMGGHQGGLDIPEDDLPDLGFSWLKYVAMTPGNLWALYRHRPSQAARFLKRFRQINDTLQMQDVGAMETSALVRTFCQGITDCMPQWNLLYLVGRTWVLPLLNKISRDWLGETDNMLLGRLFAAQGGMADTEAGLELWRLACLAREDAATEQAVRSGQSWDAIQASLSPAFVQAWQDFMREHGHHGRGELEFYNARWHEQPDYILQMIRAYLQVSEQVDPLTRRDRLIAEREHLRNACRLRLRHPLKRWLFNRALVNAGELGRDRENWKNEAVRWFASQRRLLLELAKRLTERGTLACRDDIFFLTAEELEPLASGTADFDPAERLHRRRAEYDWNAKQNPAHVVVGSFDPDKHSIRPVTADMVEFKGLGVSPGTVIGPARVILRADNHETVGPGEILVAPFTDPAWTPYFVPAAGVVMDLGGALSHGSIIAREYGLPAVVNVGCATQVIRTGQVIEVDGARGVVRILMEDRKLGR